MPVTYEDLTRQLAMDLPFLHDDDAIMFRARGRVVQLNQAGDRILAQASSNQVLREPNDLTPDQELRLQESGWARPDPPIEKFWSIQLGWPPSADEAYRFAALLIAAMRDLLSTDIDEIDCVTMNLDTQEPFQLTTATLLRHP